MTLYDDQQGTYSSTELNREIKLGRMMIARRGASTITSANVWKRINVLNPSVTRTKLKLLHIRGSVALGEDPVDLTLEWVIAFDHGSLPLNVSDGVIWADLVTYRVVTAVGIIKGGLQIDVDEDALDPEIIIDGAQSSGAGSDFRVTLYGRSDVAGIDTDHNIATHWERWALQSRFKDDRTEFPNSEEWEEAEGWGLDVYGDDQ